MSSIDQTTAAAAVPRAAGTSPRSGAVRRRSHVAVAVLLTASFTLAVDFSILNVALPAIDADVGLSLADLQWVATAFALGAAGFTLLLGRVADLFGRRRVLLAGMALLGAASLIGGLASAPWLLIAARGAQGLATAAVIPAALSLLTTTFPEGPSRARVLGLNGALMAAGFTTGAILGGLLTDGLSWRSAFFLNVIVAVLVIAVAPLAIAESRSRERRRLDVAGAVAVTLALLTSIFGVTRAGATSWGDPLAIGALLLGGAMLVVFVAVEARVTEPLVPLAVLRRRPIAWGNAAGVMAFATETSVVFLLTLYLQEVLGYSALEAGLAFALLGVGTVIGGLAGPRVIAATGTRSALAGGLAAQGCATLSLVLIGDASGWILLVLGATFAGGVANLVAIVGFMVTATSGVPDREQGLATGLATMSQQVGITLGIPVMAAVVAARGADLLDGLVVALGVNAGLCFAMAAAVAVALAPRP